MKLDFYQKRFYFFRAGNNIYIGISAALFSMIVVIHSFLIDRVSIIDEFFKDFGIFLLIFLICYIPVCIIIGNWHVRKYENLQQTYYFLQNPGFIRSLKFILEVKTGKYDKEDLEGFLHLLKKLEKNSITDELDK